MFPEFLKEFQEGLEQYRLNCIKIIATPVDNNETLGFTKSKFSGLPYLPINMNYPVDGNNVPMLLLAQINFEEVPYLSDYPSSGILQFYISKDWMDICFGDEDYKNYRVIFHEAVATEYQKDFSFLSPENLMESPVIGEHSLTFSIATEYGGSDDFRFDFEFNGLSLFEYSEQLNELEERQLFDFFQTDGHKLGGYAYFTQSDIRDYDETKKNDVVMIQIDSDDQIIFGDVGVAHFFINADDLRNKNFEKAYFQWDCC